MPSTFAINPAGLREVANGPAVTAAIQTVAKAIASRAEGTAPTRQFRVDVLDVHDTDDGVVITVGTRWSLGHLIEWGSINNQPYAPLRKAVSSLGLKFEGA